MTRRGSMWLGPIPLVALALAPCACSKQVPDREPGDPTGGSANSSASSGGQSSDGSTNVSSGGSSATGGTGSSSEPKCGPTASVAWLEEGETASVQVKCSTGLKLAGSAFTVTDLPDGAQYDATSATLTWTPSLSQAGVYSIPVVVTEYDEIGTLKIGVADAFDRNDNLPIADPATYTEEYGLPVMHLTVPSSIENNAIDPATGNKAYVPATIVYRGHTFEAEAKYRGSSSMRYPKRNYSLRFPDSDEFSEEVIAGAVKSRQHLELITTFDDPSQIRCRMAFELWNRMDPTNVRVRQFGLVLFLNGKYWGMYGAADKVSASLFGHFGYSDLGNLYMGIDHNANFAKFRYNEPNPQVETDLKTDLAQGWEKKDGTPDQGQSGAFDDLVALTNFVISSDDATFVNQLRTMIDLQNYYNWFVHTTAIQAFDTLAKNSLHYHDPVANGPWRVVLWDFNESFGQRWQTARFPDSLNPADIVYVSSGGFGYTNRNYLWKRIWNNATLSAELKARYSTLLHTTLTKDAVLALLDQMVSETASAAKRDDRKWQSQYKSYFKGNRNNDFNDSAGEAAYVRSFIEKRWTALLQLFP